MELNRPTVALLAIMFSGLTTYAASAPKHSGNVAGQTKVVTGCLRKGEQPGEFVIRDKAGHKYGLHSLTVSLAEHIGHKVTVVGKVKPRTAEDEAEKEVARIQVKNVKMIKAACE